MKSLLSGVAALSVGVYIQPGATADTLYLQTNHFKEDGALGSTVKPLIKYDTKLGKHLLQDGDVLFAAKGFNNFSAVYHTAMGQAVASSSFIVIRVQSKDEVLPEYLAWFLNNSRQIAVFHKAKATTTIPSISISQLAQLEIAIPKMEAQKLIVEIQRLQEREKYILERLQMLKEQSTRETLMKAAKK